MDEILNQHAGLMASNLSSNGASIPPLLGPVTPGGNQNMAGLAAAAKAGTARLQPGWGELLHAVRMTQKLPWRQEARDDDSNSFDSVVIIAVGLVPLRLMIAMKRGRGER
jgi:hypothetical protein